MTGNVRADTIRKLWKVETRYCAQCWTRMDFLEGPLSARLVCPNQCEPGGHVSEIYIELQRATDATKADQAARNYPELAEADGYEIADATDLRSDTAALFGSDPGDETLDYDNYVRERSELPEGYLGGIDADKRIDG